MAYDINYRPPDLLVPVGRLFPLVMNRPQIPMSMQGLVSGHVRGMADAQEIGHAFGRTRTPKLPLMVSGPDSRVPILVVGDGVTEAAELEDLAQEAIADQEERVKANSRGYDFDGAREKAGMVRREDFQQAMHDALEERIARHKANPVTDPPRQPYREPSPPQFFMGGS